MTIPFDLLQLPALAQRGPLQRWYAATSETEGALRCLVRAAWGAQTIGEAFFAGYQGALEQLIGGGGTKALLVTEPQGQHPRQLQTRLEEGRITGSKAFAMTEVDTWWVLAVAGPRDLRLCRVDRAGGDDPPGIGVSPLRTSLVEDVPHGMVTFDRVEVDEVREDAWDRVVRPFRAVEDAGVLLALTTALLGATVEPTDEDALLGIFAALTALFGATDDASFRALVGVREQLLVVAERAPIEGPLAAAWTAYRPLVDLAQRARTARLERARERTRFKAS